MYGRVSVCATLAKLSLKSEWSKTPFIFGNIHSLSGEVINGSYTHTHTHIQIHVQQANSGVVRSVRVRDREIHTHFDVWNMEYILYVASVLWVGNTKKC